jgi:hypothetical protein
MKRIITISVLASLLMGQSGIEIAKMVDEKLSPKDMSNKTKMVLTNSKGKTRANTMISKQWTEIKNRLFGF